MPERDRRSICSSCKRVTDIDSIQGKIQEEGIITEELQQWGQSKFDVVDL
jgi:hypothetical protein